MNTDGVPVTDQDYKDKFMLVYFGFTFCPDICPNELVKMSHLLDKIGTCSPTMGGDGLGWREAARGSGVSDEAGNVAWIGGGGAGG